MKKIYLQQLSRWSRFRRLPQLFHVGLLMQGRQIGQILLALSLSMSALAVQAQTIEKPSLAAPSEIDLSTFAAAKALGRGISLGNTFDAPKEGYWGVTYDEALLDRIKEAGFQTLRLPVRWTTRAKANAPYTIDPKFIQRIASVVDAAHKRDLRVVMNMHHYRQLNGEDLDEAEPAIADDIVDERYLAIWQQIAKHFNSYPDTLLFEPMNEPHKRLNADKWNRLFELVRLVIRAQNPQRYIVVGPSQWSNAAALPSLNINAQDRRLIVTIHTYDPFEFTHQGAGWTKLKNSNLGVTCCTTAQVESITKPLVLAKQWSVNHRRPIWVGEWGSFDKAAMDSRVQYTRAARSAIEAQGFTWSYWELASSFGIWDPKVKQWRTELKRALLGP